MTLLLTNNKKPLEYPLVATTTTENKYKHIKYLDLVTALQSVVLTYNFQREIKYVPKYILGLKNGSLYGTQGHESIYTLMNSGQ